jgi:hypothetical protein
MTVYKVNPWLSVALWQFGRRDKAEARLGGLSVTEIEDKQIAVKVPASETMTRWD